MHRTLGRAKDHLSLCCLLCLAVAAALNRADESKAAGKRGSAFPPVGEESEIANADEAFGKHVQQEAAQELIQRKSHQLLFVVVSRVPPTKSDLLLSQRDQAMVGDGYAMSVTTQILEYVLGASERSFGINHPVFSEQWP